MNIAEAIVEYLRIEVVPGIAGKSELTAAILNGALRAGRKRVAEKISNMELLKSFGVTDEHGNVNADTVREFFDGAFEGRDKISASVAELFKAATGVESSSDLLAGQLTFTRDDVAKFMNILSRGDS